MIPCDNCIHFPICSIQEDYRQLLVDTGPLQKKYLSFEVMARCRYFRINTNYEKTEPETIPSTININLPSARGNEAMNSL